MKKSISKFIALTLALCLCCGLLSGCGGSARTVNIYSANYEEEIAKQLEYLGELFPDYDITITYMSSGKLAAKLLAEGEDTEVDIALSLSSGYAQQLKDAGMLRTFDGGVTYLPEFRDADHMILPNGVWAGAVVVNTDILAANGLPTPASYDDLTDPVYKGHIVMANPGSSSTGYFFLHGLLNLYGEQEGWNYFDALRDNIMLFTESGSVPVTMVENGEAAIALGIDYQAMALVNGSSPVEVIFAAEGAPYDYDTSLLINRADEPNEAVLAVMAAITSAEGNALFNNYNLPVLEGVEAKDVYPDSFFLMDMEGISDSERKTEILAKWSERYE